MADSRDQPEQPNKDLMIIEEIEGLMSQVNEKVNKLNEDNKLSVFNPQTLSQQRNIIIIISTALEEIDLFQKTTLFELRKTFE